MKSSWSRVDPGSHLTGVPVWEDGQMKTGTQAEQHVSTEDWGIASMSQRTPKIVSRAPGAGKRQGRFLYRFRESTALLIGSVWTSRLHNDKIMHFHHFQPPSPCGFVTHGSARKRIRTALEKRRLMPSNTPLHKS